MTERMADDPRFTENIKAYRKAAAYSATMLIVVLVAGVLWGNAQAGESGIWSAVLGCSAAAVFTLSSQFAAVYGARRGPMGFITAVTIASFAKFFIIVIVAIVALQLEWLVRPVFAGVLLAGALAGLIIDLVTIQRARVPYVVPDKRGSDAPDDEVR